uniref:DUF148 domain-containing protein n=1 Tax=Clastoptera arizonana TaxID=38151 RepID=A0A1B6DCN0_9HEMI
MLKILFSSFFVCSFSWVQPPDWYKNLVFDENGLNANLTSDEVQMSIEEFSSDPHKRYAQMERAMQIDNAVLLKMKRIWEKEGFDRNDPVYPEINIMLKKIRRLKFYVNEPIEVRVKKIEEVQQEIIDMRPRLEREEFVRKYVKKNRDWFKTNCGGVTY